MLNKISKLALLTMLSASAFAQTTPPAGNGQPGQDGQRRRGPRQFMVNINNTSKNIELDTVQKAELIQVVKDVYVPFSQADGTRSRGFSFSVNDSLETGMIAKVGKISVSGAWLKKNFKNFGTELQTTLRKNWHSVDTVKKGDYQLVFINKNSDFSPEVRKNLIDAYFKVYPVLVSKFNDKATHNVIFITDTAYKGVAECSGNRILFSTKYMNQNPYDIDIVTHEGMHIVQGYPGGAGPGWLTEGIADYIRYKYGVDNIGSRWTLPEFKDTQSYKDAYRVTARFFEWIEQKVKPDVIMTLDQQLRTKTYTEESWTKLTGKTVDELWADYAKNPVVALKYSGKAPVKKG